MASTANAAEAIYVTGPETVIAQAKRIEAGPVSRYAKRVLSASEPPGPDAIPLKWMCAGRVEQPRALKGESAGPVNFSRTEESPMLVETTQVPEWEQAYGHIAPAGEVVLFFGDDGAQPHVIPSGHGEQDLISLIREVVAIQVLPKDAQPKAWLAYLKTARTDAGREAALRSLLHADTDWSLMRPALNEMMASPSVHFPIKAFTFGIVEFGLTKGRWAKHQVAVADFLGDELGTAQSADQALQYVLIMKLALAFSLEEASRKAREPIHASLVASLRRNQARLSLWPEVAEQYRQIRASYPGTL